MKKGTIYLISESDNPDVYKIGLTKNSPKKRLKALQTGNSSKLTIHALFETNYPFKVEKMLHKRFQLEHKLNEWFELNPADVQNFLEICDGYEKICEALKDNIFFNKM